MRSKAPAGFAAVLAGVAALSALGSLSGPLGGLARRTYGWLEAVLLLTPLNLGFAAALAVLAVATKRRKRLAYRLLLAYFVAMTLLVVAVMVVVGEDLRELSAALVVNVVAAAVLFWARKEFRARIRRAGIWRALLTFVSVAAIGIGLGYSLVSAFPGTLETPLDRLRYSAGKVLGGFGFVLRAEGAAPRWVGAVLGIIGAVAVFAALWTLVRTQHQAAELSLDDETRIRQLLDADGDSASLGYFATRRDRAAVFAPDGGAAVTYRVVNGVSLAIGDPVGDPGSWQPAIEGWLSEARSFGWVPAVLAAGETAVAAYERAGLQAMPAGEEAILVPEESRLDSEGSARVRRQADIPVAELRELARLATLWGASEHERAFATALGRLGDPADGRCVLVEAFDRDGRITALMSLCPWGDAGLTVDLVRYERSEPSVLLQALVRQAKALGVQRVSLNFGASAEVLERASREGAGPIRRAWRRLVLTVIHPRWRELAGDTRKSRYLCFANRQDLGRVSLAAAGAEALLPGSHAVPLDHTAAPHPDI